jgi:sporulation protein YlmC with PRC-barrel domain
VRHPIVFGLIGAAFACNVAQAQTTSPPAAAPAAQSAAATTMKAGQWRSSKLVGLNVYNNNNEKIGDINELIVGRDGKIESVVIGAGGFLGMGERDVAVPFSQVKFVEEPRRTTTATDNRPANPNAPAANPPPAGAPTTTTTASRPADRMAATDAYRGYPDHAMVEMSKDQLKSLPEIRYSR